MLEHPVSAGPMYAVAARAGVKRLTGRVQVLQTDGAVVPAGARPAEVTAVPRRPHPAGAAPVTVERALPASDSTQPAVVAVILVPERVVQSAHAAEVLAELRVTALTGAADRLLVAAHAALNLRDLVPVDGVLLSGVMADAAPEELATAGSHQTGLPPVVLTSPLLARRLRFRRVDGPSFCHGV